MNYKETIEYLIANTSLREAKVFEFAGDPGEEYFQKLFEFYTGNLKHNSHFGANPSFIVYYGKNEVYAEAKKSNAHYILAFDKGIVYRLERWFGLYFDFDQITELESFKELSKELDHKISELLEQSINHFTFYHEFAHLIQFAQEESFEREDYLTGNCEYDENMQTEEFDADTFAGICLATHLFQLIHKWMTGRMNNHNLNELTSIIVGSVMAYILALPMCKEEFYTEEGSHPHNSIRALNILGVISTHFKEILVKKNYQLSIDDGNLFRRSAIVLEKLLIQFGLEDTFKRFQLDVRDNGTAIKSYHETLKSRMIAYEFSAVKQWNAQNKIKKDYL